MGVCYNARTFFIWGGSSVGRASRSQRGGQGFESPSLHHPSGMSPSSGRGLTPRPFGLYAAPQATCAREAGEVSQGRGGREARVAGELTAKTQGGADVRAASPDVASAITARPTLTKPKFTRSAAATASRVGASANSSPRNGSAKSPSSATTEAGRCASKPPQRKPSSPPCLPSTKPNPLAPERGGFLSSSFP